MKSCLCDLKIRSLYEQIYTLNDKIKLLELENEQLKKPKKIFISYHEYGLMLSQLVNHIKTIGKYNVIIAPPRGSLAMAIHLSHNLKIDNIFYDFHSIDMNVNKKHNIILVDDIVDTGQTMIKWIKFVNKNCKFNDLYTCSLFYKKRSEYIPNFYIEETKHWIVFPWECHNEKPNREGYDGLSTED